MKIIINNQNTVFGYTIINDENILFSYNVKYNQKLYCIGLISFNRELTIDDCDDILNIILYKKGRKETNFTYQEDSSFNKIYLKTDYGEFTFADEVYLIDFILSLKEYISPRLHKSKFDKLKYELNDLWLRTKLFFLKGYVPLYIINSKFIAEDSLSTMFENKIKNS